MATLNLGILAHVDAGKTSLTERLLYAAGVIDHPGRVDHGATQTDSLEFRMTESTTLVHRLIEDDEIAWEEFVSRYGGLLRAIARRFRLSPEDAADAAQTT